MPKITINAKEYELPANLNLLDACRQAGYEIPHFCYHPALTITGSCRMCQIEIEQGGRKSIAIACNTKVAEGMILHLNSEPTKQTQASVLEFLLLNHPLDCPICDDAGECKLQNYYMLYDRQKSRMGEPKIRKHKVVDLGPNIVLDSERCVLCSRCVRFLREIVGKEELEIFNIGANSEIGPLPGKILDNDYSGNVVDLCPVGALTDRRFRFKRRVWYLKKVDSICPGCSRGCNIELHFDPYHRWQNPGHRLQRIKPRLNFEVNKYWLCDKGRYGSDFVDAPDRLRKALVRKDGKLMETGLDDAIRQMSAAFRQALSGENRAKTAVIAAPQISSEALQLLKKMVDKLGIVNVDYRVPSVQAGELDNLLQMKDRNPNSYAAKNIGLIPAPGGKSFPEIIQWIKTGEIQNLLAICCNPLEFFGEADKKALERLKFFALLHWTKVPTVEFAHFVLPLATYVEYNGTFTNFQGREQRFFRAFVPLGEAIAPDEAFEKICKYS